MKEAIPSITTGTLTTVLASLSGVAIIETIILAFLGGAVGYLAKIATEWTISKIKNSIK